jgi:hypothetical protein
LYLQKVVFTKKRVILNASEESANQGKRVEHSPPYFPNPADSSLAFRMTGWAFRQKGG